MSERSEPRLDIATKLSDAVKRVQWQQTVYPDAGEVVLWVEAPPGREVDVEAEAALLSRREVEGSTHDELDAEEAEAEARRRSDRSAASARARARTKVRRYCKANRLDRLFTLTFRRDERDPEVVSAEVRRFFIRLREATGAMPYLWVREQHTKGDYHVHFALSRPLAVRCGRPGCGGKKGIHVKRIGGPCLSCTWGLGYVDARRLKVKTARAASVVAATYLAKYVGKAYDDGEASVVAGERPRRLHRYEVGQSFQPRRVEAEVEGPEGDVLEVLAATFFAGREPVFVWSSDSLGDEWEAPPVRVAFFDPPSPD